MMSQTCLHLLVLIIIIPLNVKGQSRLESEYKLSVPEQVVIAVEQYIMEEFSEGDFQIDSVQLTIDHAEEIFIDCYFDDAKNRLLKQDIGLRHRLRYNEDKLVNELIQLKLPNSLDGIIRREIKYKVPTKMNALDQLSRHPVLQFVHADERDRFSYALRQRGVDVKDLREELSLVQQRKRIYVADEKGSVATLSLDHVNNKKFPYQEFHELEIEINEIRYTEADELEKTYLENINQFLKRKVTSQFPELTIDQTPKYNKLKSLLDESITSQVVDYGMWVIYGFVLIVAAAKLIRL